MWSRERESSRVDRFSNSQLVLWMQPPFQAHPSLQQAHQLPKGSSDPTPSGSKVFNGSQVTSEFKSILIQLDHKALMWPQLSPPPLSHMSHSASLPKFSVVFPPCAGQSRKFFLFPRDRNNTLFHVLFKSHRLHDALIPIIHSLSKH